MATQDPAQRHDEMQPMTLELRVDRGAPNVVFTKGIPSYLELDALIAELARQRGLIEPPVPSDLPPGRAVALRIEDEPEAELNQELDGSSVLCVRHPGFGWLAFRFGESAREWLIKGLTAHVEGQNLPPRSTAH